MEAVFNYRRTRFHVPMLIWFQLNFIWLKLLFIRSLRFLKRVVIDIKPLFFVAVFAVVFAGLIGMLGVALEKYVVWYESFWDLKIFLFTSVFLSGFSLVTTGEREHRKKLKQQENEYFEFLFHSECFFRNVFGIFNEDYKHNLFQTENAHNRFLTTMKNLSDKARTGDLTIQLPKQFDESTTVFDCLTFFFKEYRQTIESIRKFSTMLVNYTEAQHLAEMCDNACRELREKEFIIKFADSNYSAKLTEILEFMGQLHGTVASIIGCLRRPWRYMPDSSLDNKTRCLLRVNGRIDEGEFNPLSYWKAEQEEGND